jgi:hypothetical protein
LKNASIISIEPDTPIEVQVAAYLGTISDNLEIFKTKLAPGEYHSMIWRQQAYFNNSTLVPAMKLGSRYEREFSATIQAVSNLFIQGSDIFRYIEPASATNSAFGHRIREVLILACIEVEAAWKAILMVNGGVSSQDRPTTKHYVELLPIMRLDEWEIRLANYPAYPAFKPFGNWSANKPTQTLPWYDAYNSVKHDMEIKFSDARLDYMIQFLGACFVMMIAQFGSPTTYTHDTHYPMLFSIIKEPNWSLAEQYVMPFSLPEREGKWVPVQFCSRYPRSER